MKALKFNIELTQHIAGNLTGRVTRKGSKKVSIFKIPLSKIDNPKYFTYTLMLSIKKLEI